MTSKRVRAELEQGVRRSGRLKKSTTPCYSYTTRQARPLPPEIWQRIIEFSIDLPTKPNHADQRWSLGELFTSPFMRLNRNCRQHLLERIGHDCLWIKVEPMDMRLFDICVRLGRKTPLAKKPWLDLLPDDRPELTFRLSSGLEQNSAQQPIFVSHFMFNYQSFLYLITEMKWLGPDLRAEINYVGATRPAIKNLLQQQVIPLVNNLHCLSALQITGLGIVVGDEHSLQQFPDAGIIYKNLTFALEESERLRNLGHGVEADLLPLRMGPVMAEYLCSGVPVPAPAEWVSEYLAAPGWLEDPRPLQLLEVARAFLLNECEAFHAYNRFLGGDEQWVDAHGSELTEVQTTEGDHTRWLDEPACTYFGVADIDRARWHSIKGDIAAMSFAKELYDHHRSGGRLSSELLDNFQGALTEFACAMLLDTDNLGYVRQYRKLCEIAEAALGGSLEGIDSELAIKHSYTDVDGNEREWVGTDEILENWGQDTLKYLPRAQRMLHERGASLPYSYTSLYNDPTRDIGPWQSLSAFLSASEH